MPALFCQLIIDTGLIMANIRYDKNEVRENFFNEGWVLFK